MRKSNLAYKENEAPQIDDEDSIFANTAEVERLNKDLRAASKVLSADEARYLVSAYYAVQDMRKRFSNQERAMEKAGQPHAMVSYMAKQAHRMEKQIQISLDVYTANDKVGQWLRANKGIGPVIAAGLAAHVDINRAPTVGHIWRYAGLDPDMKWHGKAVSEIIKAARADEDTDWEAMVRVAREVDMRVSSILVNAKAIERDEVVSVEDALAYLTRKLKGKVKVAADFHSDNALREVLPDPADLAQAYADLYPKVKLRWEEITKTLAKRPWNSELKTLCWKIGESFKKVSGSGEGKRPSPYGLIYRDRKRLEIERNEAGQFADIAKDILVKRKIAKTTDAYYWYSGEWVNNPRLNPILQAEFEVAKGTAPEGKSEAQILLDCIKEADRPLKPRLSPAHIDARASRYAVKFFLSHFHHAATKRVLGIEPAKPYPIEHLGHVHYIAPFVRDDDEAIAEEVAAE